MIRFVVGLLVILTLVAATTFVKSRPHSVMAGITNAVAPVVHAQAMPCGYVVDQVLYYGGSMEFTGASYLNGYVVRTFTAYFPAYGEWWYGMCFDS